MAPLSSVLLLVYANFTFFAVFVDSVNCGNTATLQTPYASSFEVQPTAADELEYLTGHLCKQGYNFTDYTTSSDVSLQTTEQMGDHGEWLWYPLRWSWTIILQLISAIVGVIGNGMVIIVVFNRRVRRNSTDVLIGSLAVADFFSSLFIIPTPKIKRVPANALGEFYCRMIDSQGIMWCCILSSVFTLTTISLERFAAVAYPFQFRYLFSKRRTTAYIIGNWLFSCSFYIPFHYFFKKADPLTHTCIYQYGPYFRMVMGLLSITIKFVGPFLIMLVSQTLTALTLHRQSKTFKGSAEGMSAAVVRLHAARRRIIEMLLIVVIIFVICWGPSQIAFALIILGFIDYKFLFSPILQVFVVVGFYNSCANPVIYTARNADFRKAVKHIFSREKKASIAVFGVRTPSGESDSTLVA